MQILHPLTAVEVAERVLVTGVSGTGCSDSGSRWIKLLQAKENLRAVRILSTPDGPLSSGLAAREARGSGLGTRGSRGSGLGARGSGPGAREALCHS